MSLETVLLWAVIGLIAGWLASAIVGGPFGLIGDIVVGIVGAFIGGLILSRGEINNAPLTVTTFLVSLLGAVVLLGVVNLVRRGSLR